MWIFARMTCVTPGTTSLVIDHWVQRTINYKETQRNRSIGVVRSYYASMIGEAKKSMKNFNLDQRMNPVSLDYEAGVLLCGPRRKVCLWQDREPCIGRDLLATLHQSRQHTTDSIPCRAWDVLVCNVPQWAAKTLGPCLYCYCART